MARKIGSDGVKTAQAIARASVRLIAERGFNAVSMRAIAESVDVQPGTLYQYFPSKQQLLVDIMRGHMELLLKAWNDQDHAGCCATDMLERFARFHIRFHIERPDDVFISYMEMRSLDAPGLAEISAFRGRYETILKNILKRGMGEGTFAIADPHVVAMAILAMITGVNTWYRDGGRLSLTSIESMYVAMVLGSVGVHKKELINV